MVTSLQGLIDINASASAAKNGRSTTGALPRQLSLANGTAANQADKAFYERRTIAASGSPDALDFAGGGLIDLNGDAITWVEMVALVIYNASATIAIVVGNHANPLDFGIGGTATMTIKPGETKVLINTGADPAYAITAGSADTLKVAIASGALVEYETLAIGRSA